MGQRRRRLESPPSTERLGQRRQLESPLSTERLSQRRRLESPPTEQLGQQIQPESPPTEIAIDSLLEITPNPLLEEDNFARLWNSPVSETLGNIESPIQDSLADAIQSHNNSQPFLPNSLHPQHLVEIVSQSPLALSHHLLKWKKKKCKR